MKRHFLEALSSEHRDVVEVALCPDRDFSAAAKAFIDKIYAIKYGLILYSI
jgi:hypothetical protein